MNFTVMETKNIVFVYISEDTESIPGDICHRDMYLSFYLTLSLTFQ